MSQMRAIKNRIRSVQTTRQITATMKVVALARLKRRHAEFLQTVPFAEEMNRVVRRLIRSVRFRQERLFEQNQNKVLTLPTLINGNGREKRYVVIVMTSDDGLSGTAAAQVVSKAGQLIDYLKRQDKEIHVFFYGVKGSDILKRRYPDLPIIIIRQKKERVQKGYAHAERIASDISELFHRDRFDVCLVVYNQFQSIVSQKAVIEQVVPNQLFLPENPWNFLNQTEEELPVALRQRREKWKKSAFWSAIGGEDVLPSLQGEIFKADVGQGTRPADAYDYEPSDLKALNRVLPRYLTAYWHRVILESQVSDNAARLMAMDNASRNADDMLDRLNKTCRRIRQTTVTTDIAEASAGSIQENPL